MLRSLILLAAAAALAGCGAKEPAGAESSKPSGSPASDEAVATITPDGALFPLKAGNQWVYKAEVQTPGGGESDEVTFEIAEVNGTDAKIRVISPGSSELTGWRVDAKGIFQTHSDDMGTLFTPPQPLLIFNQEVGEERSTTITGPRPDGSVGEFLMSFKPLGTQEVDTPSGRLTAYAVVTLIQWQSESGVDGLTTSTSWFAPDIGLVRLVEDSMIGGARQKFSLKLKSHSLE